MSVQTTAAMHEERNLASYYRQRNQYLAETVLTLEAENASLKAVLEQLRPAPDTLENSEE